MILVVIDNGISCRKEQSGKKCGEQHGGVGEDFVLYPLIYSLGSIQSTPRF